MNKILTGLMFGITILWIPVSFANVVLTPKRIVMEDDQRVAELLVVNKSSESKRYRISVIEKQMLETGKIVDLEDDSFVKSAKPHFLFSPRQIVIQGNSTQKIRIMSKIRNNTERGEYRSHLLIRNIPKPKKVNFDSKEGIGMSISAVYGLVIPIIMRKGDLTVDLKVNEAKILSKDGRNMIELTMNRAGDRSTFGEFEIVNNNDELITKVTGVATYMPLTKRKLSLELSKEKLDLINNNKVKVKYTDLETKAKQEFELTVN